MLNQSAFTVRVVPASTNERPEPEKPEFSALIWAEIAEALIMRRIIEQGALGTTNENSNEREISACGRGVFTDDVHVHRDCRGSNIFHQSLGGFVRLKMLLRGDDLLWRDGGTAKARSDRRVDSDGRREGDRCTNKSDESREKHG